MGLERYFPQGETPFQRALDKAAYQDATLSFLEIAERGDKEMEKVVLERVKALTGKKPKNLQESLKVMLEDF